MSDLEFLKQVNETIETNKEDMISSLSHLLQIPSVAVETPGEYPFGENVQKAYDAMLDIAAKRALQCTMRITTADTSTLQEKEKGSWAW